MLNKPRQGIVRSLLAHGTLAAFLAMTALGCSASSLAAPTPTIATARPAAPTGVSTVTAGTVKSLLEENSA